MLADLSALEWGVASCVILLALTWVGYPLVLLVAGGSNVRQASSLSAVNPEVGVGDSTYSSVDVVFAAYNEAAVIHERIENLQRELESVGEWRIRVGDDCSNDGTGAILDEQAAGDHRIEVFHAEERTGKVGLLKQLVGMSDADVLVFTDANTFFEEGAVAKLLSSFENLDVGGVCGRLVFKSQGAEQTEESAYWDFETWLKSQESALDSCLGANGAIYAIRRELFWQAVPGNTIVDDFVIGMKIREQGKRMRYVADAVATEDTPDGLQDEWHRRVRIGAGDYQALALCRRCLNPKNGWFAFCFFWHKVMRWFTPHLLAASLVLSTLACVQMASVPAAIVLLCFCSGSLLALIGRAILPKPLSTLCNGGYYFLLMQAALLTGWFKYLGGGLQGAWERTEREGERNDG